MKQVVIFGTGDFAQVAYVYLSKDSPHRVAAFTVHEKYIAERTLLGLESIRCVEQMRCKGHPGIALGGSVAAARASPGGFVESVAAAGADSQLE